MTEDGIDNKEVSSNSAQHANRGHASPQKSLIVYRFSLDWTILRIGRRDSKTPASNRDSDGNLNPEEVNFQIGMLTSNSLIERAQAIPIFSVDSPHTLHRHWYCALLLDPFVAILTSWKEKRTWCISRAWKIYCSVPIKFLSSRSQERERILVWLSSS